MSKRYPTHKKALRALKKIFDNEGKTNLSYSRTEGQGISAAEFELLADLHETLEWISQPYTKVHIDFSGEVRELKAGKKTAIHIFEVMRFKKLKGIARSLDIWPISEEMKKYLKVRKRLSRGSD